MGKTTHMSRGLLAGAVLALSSLGAQAGFVTAGYFGTQGPPPSFPVNTPPALGTDVANAIAAFNGTTRDRSVHSYENGLASFSYGVNQTASVTAGTPVVVDGNLLQNTNLGRYNMTTGLPCMQPTPDGCEQEDRGKWLEANASFTYTLTQSLSALSFFGTDFGDFDATVELELLLNGATIFRQGIETIPTAHGNTRGTPINGNLVYFGVVGESDADIFNGFRFNIGQLPGGQALDFIGIDSLTLGTSTRNGPPPGGSVPTPSSLALAGLGLMLMARYRRRRR